MLALLVFLTLLAAVLTAAVVTDFRHRRRVIAGRDTSSEAKVARAAASAQRFISGSGGT
jgi:hypothetical protein